ncbi:MAG: glycosyl transferase [Burkholderiales bacterium]|jgi:4-amino-4-deoxy-L-arabinose transferase-like glycosyltransferase|nr:glycosyl transferase [Burkholderiales bacterium]
MFKSFKDRIKDNELLSAQLIQFLILVSIIVECYGLFSKILGSNDSNFYSTVAKHIATSNDWVNLYYAGTDWLDKPRIPFWLTAISYKIFGINPFSYILPGFLFNLLGGFYTYRLGVYLYSRQVGLLALLLYFTSLHLMLSAIDIRAEAFLLGEIIPACYYLLRYNDSDKVDYRLLFLSSIFTALAIMTKGLFILLAVYSGVIAIWLFGGQYKNFISRKWLYALCLSLIFILPELICLFLQFDLHPEKVMFGKTGVSGLRFFFWDSQFGRFFDFGPYVSSGQGGYAHYFYFMHTFMWAFLPWSMVFLVTLYYVFGQLRLSNDILQVKQQKQNQVFLLASFFIPFILFSLTKFQLDHYTNIIIPFACILCANWVCNYASRIPRHWVFIFQIYLALILTALSLVFSFLIFDLKGQVEIFVLGAVIVGLYTIFIRNRVLNKAIVYPCLAINLVFVFTQMVNNKIYVNYNAGYQIATFLNSKSQDKVFDYGVNSSSLEFHLKAPYQRITDFKQLPNSGTYFLVTPQELESGVSGGKLVKRFDAIDQNKFNLLIFNRNKLNAGIKKVSLLYFSDTLSPPGSMSFPQNDVSLPRRQESTTKR